MAKRKNKSIAAGKAGKAQRSPGAVVAIVLCAFFLLIAVVAAGACYYLYNFDFNGKIMDNVSIAGVDVGGMTRKEAISAVNAAAEESYTSSPMVVKVFDVAVEIAPEESEAKLNTTLAVWDAYRYGRRGFSAQKKADLEKSENGGIQVDLSHYLKLNKKGIETALSEFANHYNTTLTQSTYEVTGTAPELTLVVNLGVPEYGLDLSALQQLVVEAYCKNQMLLETECELMAPEDIDLAAIRDTHSTTATNAAFDPNTFDVIEGINGCTLDVEAAQATLSDTPYGERVEIPFKQIAPETTGDALRALLFRDELGHHVAFQSSSSSRATNLRLACESINGVVILPGQTFSYNETLGERTTERGYQTGIAYIGGESVPSIGGGICQVSSTLYYCALQADLEIIKRENHCYAPGYVPLGMDATVSWGALDFCFRNDKDYPIRIDAKADGGEVTISLMGTDTKDYYIEMEYVVTAYYKYEVTYEEMTADNEKGYKDGDYIKSPINGYDVVTYRCKYSKATKELISRDFEAKSHFSKKDAVICKIVTAPTTPPADSTTPTDPTTPPSGEDTPGIGNGGVTEDGGELPE